MECGKRVGKGVVSYPCYVEITSPGMNHPGPCAAMENDASQRQRRTWMDAEVERQRAAQEEQEAFPVRVVEADAGPPPPSDGAGIHRAAAMARIAERGSDMAEGQLGKPVHGSLHQVLGDPDEPFAKAADRGGQPVPTHQPGAPSMHDLLIAEIEKRKSLGLSRYGTILQANNGRNALQDLLDELIDGCVYLMQEIEERRLREEAAGG